MSFVNSIATSKGGTHVNHVTDQVWRVATGPSSRVRHAARAPCRMLRGACRPQVVDRVLEHLKKKHKGLDKILKPSHVTRQPAKDPARPSSTFPSPREPVTSDHVLVPATGQEPHSRLCELSD